MIIINVVVFILSYSPHLVQVPGGRIEEPLRSWAEMFMLTPVRPYIWQFVSYAFLHGSYMHIFGNMYFLYLFGNNVNDKLGNIGYLCLYLGGAVFAGIGHILMQHNNPVLGASGAVAAITGAYLVLFPQTIITVVYWFIFIGTIDISALYFIAFKLIVWDNVVEPKFSVDAVAYDAHLAGYVFGVGAMILLFALKLIDSNYTDMWSMIRQWNRRRKFRDTVSDEYDPFKGRGIRKPVRVKVQNDPVESEQSEKILQLRAEISGFINGRNLPEAANRYLELIDLDSEQYLPRQYQLDISNQLMSMGAWSESARAYEVFLAHYSSYEHVEQVRLMLGVLYSRYLDKPENAITQLQAAKERLTDPGQIKMCSEELEKLKK